MKLATYRAKGGGPKVGVAEAERAACLRSCGGRDTGRRGRAPFGSMLALIDADDRGLDAARALLEQRGGEVDLWAPLDAVEVLAPLPEPRQMRDAMSFATHIRQSARGALAVQALKTRGEEAFRAAMAAPLGELPRFTAKFRFTISPTARS